AHRTTSLLLATIARQHTFCICDYSAAEYRFPCLDGLCLPQEPVPQSVVEQGKKFHGRNPALQRTVPVQKSCYIAVVQTGHGFAGPLGKNQTGTEKVLRPGDQSCCNSKTNACVVLVGEKLQKCSDKRAGHRAGSECLERGEPLRLADIGAGGNG